MLHSAVLASSEYPLAAGLILSGIKGIFVAIGSVIAAVICGIIASTKGRNPLGGGFWGCSSPSSHRSSSASFRARSDALGHTCGYSLLFQTIAFSLCCWPGRVVRPLCRLAVHAFFASKAPRLR